VRGDEGGGELEATYIWRNFKTMHAQFCFAFSESAIKNLFDKSACVKNFLHFFAVFFLKGSEGRGPRGTASAAAGEDPHCQGMGHGAAAGRGCDLSRI
jgi:hypothetical protein